VLPLVPPEEEYWSPYTGLDALCGSTLVISLSELVKEGLLDSSDLPEEVPQDLPADFFKVSHLSAHQSKARLEYLWL
jgi:4-alpha-glucanotransferase